ncbi:MAG: DUF86 domain-containing protein [Chloroflexi bacterium]|nr:DUF86 domain-containing protein [Chloroflexota bacterium]
MQEADSVRLRHMLDAARQAVEFARSRSRADLDRDPMLALALVKLVEIVGEAASQVSDPGRANAPSLPWAEIISMRHRLVHAYFDINLDILWQTIRHDLPPLIAALDANLPSDESDSSR